MPSSIENLLSRVGYSPFIRWASACLVLVANAMEHVAFYSINKTIVYYLTSTVYAWNMTNANIALAAHEIIKYLMMFLGGFLADFVMGRRAVLFIAYISYFIGLLGLLLLNLNADPSTPEGGMKICVPSSHIHKKPLHYRSPLVPISKHKDAPYFFMEDCSPFVICFLGLIATGGGFIETVIPVLGADQVHPMGSSAIRTFFVLFYMSSNIGALLANLFVSFTEYNINIKSAILILFLTLCISAACLMVGCCFFLLNPAKASLRTILTILKEGVQQRNIHSEQSEIDGHIGCLDRTKLNNGGNFDDMQVEGVKRYGFYIVAFLLLIPYCLLYCQLDTFILQGAHMNLKLDWYANYKVPATFVAGFNDASIVLMAPLIAFGIYPWLQRITTGPCMRLRVLTGMLLISISLLIAGIVETHRLEVFWGPHNNTTDPAPSSFNQTIGNTTYWAANMSILWLIPQNVLLGVSELLVYVTALEFAYISSVPRLHCFSLATITLSMGVSRAIAEGLASGLDGVIYNRRNINWREPCVHPERINNLMCWESHLDYIFYGLSVTQALFIPIVAVVVYRVWPLIFNSAAALEYQEDEEEEEEDDERDPLLGQQDDDVVAYQRCYSE